MMRTVPRPARLVARVGVRSFRNSMRFPLRAARCVAARLLAPVADFGTHRDGNDIALAAKNIAADDALHLAMDTLVRLNSVPGALGKKVLIAIHLFDAVSQIALLASVAASALHGP